MIAQALALTTGKIQTVIGSAKNAKMSNVSTHNSTYMKNRVCKNK